MAKSAGFCFGVKRAVDMVYEQIDTGKKIYTYGPIIHNEEVVGELEKKGVTVMKELKELSQQEKGIVVIRSHGVDRKVYETIENSGHTVADATCPFVKKIHTIVQKQSSEGRRIIIIGNAGHPEVEAICGWCKSAPVVVESEEEARQFSANPGEKFCIVSQTTFNYNKFQDLVEIFREKGYDIVVVNTICNATEERQTEARQIAQKVDVMIVIGGTHSSNSRKLYEICKAECENTYFIQTLEDLHLELPESARSVGITAGASTPNNIIEEVQNYVRINF